MQKMGHYKSSVSGRIIKIAIITIAVSMGMILISVSSGKGLQLEIKKKTTAFNGHLQIVPFENNQSEISISPIIDSIEIKKKLIKRPEVIHLHSTATKASIIKNQDQFEGVFYKGVDIDYKWEYLKSFLDEGRFPNISDVVSNEIIISQEISDRLKVKLGDHIEAFFYQNINQNYPNVRKFKVVGFFSTGFSEIDKSFIIGDIKNIKSINKWKENHVGNYEVFLSDIRDIDKIGNVIYNDLPSNLNVVGLYEKYPDIFQWISLFDFNIFIIFFIMIIVGVVNTSSAILILILERSKMIGLLKSIGSNNFFIQKIFIWNGISMLGYGLFWGNLIGLIFYFTQYFFKWIKLDPEIYYTDYVPVYLDLKDLIFFNLLFLTISGILLFLPSVIIGRISPAKVLRFN
jgi:lipoprotein-releasing system permease protein